jgi:drug/metabolite transporter (DMT)-like permease
MDLLYAWLASIASGIEPIVIKASSRSLVTNPWLFNVLWIAFGIPLVVIFAIANGAGMPKDWLLIVATSLTAAGFYIGYTVSLYKIDVSTMSPLFSLRTVFAVLLGVGLLHERLTVLTSILIIIIVLASPFAAYDETLRFKAFLQKPILITIAAMLSLALMGYFTNRSSHVNGYATTLLWQDTLVLAFLIPTLFIAKVPKHTFTRKTFMPFIALGISAFIYTAAATAAYTKNLALSSVIVSLPLSMIFAVILSKRYSKFLEKHSLKVYLVRFTAASIMVAAAITLSLST